MYVVSTMGSGDLGREIDVDAVIESLGNEFDIEATRHSDSMVAIRLEPDGPAFTLYRTGTYQIRGTDSRETLFEASDDFLNALRSVGMEFSEPDFEQNNAVYLEDFEMDIQLETLAVHLGLENVEYEPEQFPGVIYRPPEIGTVNLIFSSGKTIISGTIQDEVAEQSSEHLRKQLSTLSI
jgi:transcription initiation factor TFIID TATA-box-binding protein